jgi:predicted metal-binding protein
VRLKCTVPRCLRAGETPNCPPNAPDTEFDRRALSRFSRAILIKSTITPMEEYAPATKGAAAPANPRRTLDFHKNNMDIIFNIEKEAYKDGYHLVMGFGGGSCKDYLCKGVICQFLDSGRCRFPGRSRPAMEAMGIDVVSLINKVGWESYALVGDLSKIPCAVSIACVFIY